MKRYLKYFMILLLISQVSEARIVNGSVTCGSKKLSGVVVTDGKNFTQTGRNGKFCFEICDSAEFVYIVTPSGYVADWSDGSPAFYRKASGQSSFTFDLQKMNSVKSSYNIIAVGDPQPRSKAHFDEFAGEPLEDIRKCVDAMSAPAVGIVLGDITFDKYYLMKNWKEKIVQAGIPFYPVIGNHDHNRDFNDDGLSAVPYQESFGPADYAFCIGKDMVLVLDNIIYHSRSGYELGYTAQQLDWIRGLMTFVP